MVFDKNSSVIITLDAQFGIKPNKLAINGPKKLSFNKSFDKFYEDDCIDGWFFAFTV